MAFVYWDHFDMDVDVNMTVSMIVYGACWGGMIWSVSMIVYGACWVGRIWTSSMDVLCQHEHVWEDFELATAKARAKASEVWIKPAFNNDRDPL